MSPFGWEIFFHCFSEVLRRNKYYSITFIASLHGSTMMPWLNGNNSTASHFQGSSHSIPDQNSSLLLQSWFSSPESAPGATEPSGNSYLNAFGHNFPHSSFRSTSSVPNATQPSRRNSGHISHGLDLDLQRKRLSLWALTILLSQSLSFSAAVDSIHLIVLRRPVVLKLWVNTSWGCISAFYIRIYNSSKVTVLK